IVATQPLSGAHLNPLVTLLAWRDREVVAGDVGAYILAHLAGAITGVILAHVMFGLGPITLGANTRSTVGEFVGEIVATAGLLATIRLVAVHGVPTLAAAVA